MVLIKRRGPSPGNFRRVSALLLVLLLLVPPLLCPVVMNPVFLLLVLLLRVLQLLFPIFYLALCILALLCCLSSLSISESFPLNPPTWKWVPVVKHPPTEIPYLLLSIWCLVICALRMTPRIYLQSGRISHLKRLRSCEIIDDQGCRPLSVALA